MTQMDVMDVTSAAFFSLRQSHRPHKFKWKRNSFHRRDSSNVLEGYVRPKKYYCHFRKIPSASKEINEIIYIKKVNVQHISILCLKQNIHFSSTFMQNTALTWDIYSWSLKTPWIECTILWVFVCVKIFIWGEHITFLNYHWPETNTIKNYCYDLYYRVQYFKIAFLEKGPISCNAEVSFTGVSFREINRRKKEHWYKKVKFPIIFLI